MEIFTYVSEHHFHQQHNLIEKTSLEQVAEMNVRAWVENLL